MSWETDSQGFLADLAQRPAARSPATLGEIWSSDWNRSGLDTTFGVGKPLNDAYDELARASGAAGIDVETVTRNSVSHDERARRLRDASATLPEEARKTLEPLLDIRRRAAESAQKTEKEAAEVGAVTYGLSGVATSWAAGIARQAVDPINLATLPIGGPLKGPVLKMLLREAAIGGVSQAIQEPAIQSARGELGLEAGFGHGAVNVAQAALGAAGMAGLFRVGAWGLRAVRGASPDVGIRTADAPGAVSRDPDTLDIGGVRNNAPTDSAALRAVEPEDLAAAAHVAERDQMVDAAAPVRTPEAVADHAQKVHDAAAALERGTDIPATPPEIRWDRATTGEGKTPVGSERHQTIIDVDPRALDSAFKAGSRSFYDLPAGPMEKLKAHVAAGGEVSIPEIALTAGKRPGRVDFVNGRHRVRLAAEMGLDSIPVAVDRGQEDALRALIAKHAPEAPAAPALPTSAPPAPAPKPKKGPAARPEETWTLFEFIASRGGLRPDPELDLLLGGHNPFVPGFGPLIRKKGMGLDRMREAAVEARYLTDAPASEAQAAGTMQMRPSESTIVHLLEAIDRQARGERQYRMGREGTVTTADASRHAEREAHDVAREIDARLTEAEIDPATVDPAIRKRMTEMFTREGVTDMEIAFERAVMEDSERFERASRARRETTPDIPGWDFPDDPGAAPGGGGKPARGSGSGGAADRGQPRDGGNADRTPGSEGGETAVIGDPVLAREVERIIAEHGDFEIHHNGGKLKFSEAMRQVANDDEAARVLAECIGATA